LEIDCAAINPELLTGNPFAFSKRANFRDLLLDVGRQFIPALKTGVFEVGF